MYRLMGRIYRRFQFRIIFSPIPEKSLALWNSNEVEIEALSNDAIILIMGMD
jgi:hypothetical protein